jgi:hypothetical protein
LGEDLIAYVIIRFNTVETKLKGIIANYINSDKEYFVSDCLLNNLVINFHTKFTLLRIIAKENKIDITKDFRNAIHNISSIRNAVAHSDQLDNLSIISGEIDSDGISIPIYGLDPDIITIQNDEIITEKLVDKKDSFNKYYNIVISELENIESKLIREF